MEVHTGGARGVATFKWSRDNATVETSIESIVGNKVTVADVGKDEVLEFANGQWVEIVDRRVGIEGRSARRWSRLTAWSPRRAESP